MKSLSLAIYSLILCTGIAQADMLGCKLQKITQTDGSTHYSVSAGRSNYLFDDLYNAQKAANTCEDQIGNLTCVANEVTAKVPVGEEGFGGSYLVEVQYTHSVLDEKNQKLIAHTVGLHACELAIQEIATKSIKKIWSTQASSLQKLKNLF